MTGQELEEFKRKEKDKKAEDPNLAMLDDESSSDEEMETTGKSASSLKPIKHDIIMRVPGDGSDPASSRPRAFFKSNRSKFPMYPHHEEKIRWDDYGEIIKPEDWIDPNAVNNEQADDLGSLNVDEEGQDLSEIPTKCIQQNLTLSIKAQIQYIDFEGRSDGESMMKLIMQVKPRRVVIVRGSDEACKKMAQIATTVTNEIAVGHSNKKVFLPKTGEFVDATTESFIYQVRLPDSLMSKLSFQHAKDNAYLAWVDGTLTFEQNEIMDIDNPDGENAVQSNSVIPTLHPMPEEQVHGHATSFVNELKLSDFKMVLSKHNINSEFQGGVLFCGTGNVALRRHDSGRVTIEGCVSEEYYLVRDLLYQQYAIV